MVFLRLRTLPSRRWSTAGLVLGFVGCLLAWQLLAILVQHRWPERAIFLPSVAQVASQGWKMVTSLDFWKALGITNFRVVTGFLVAAAVAVPLGIALGAYPRLEVLASPVTDFARYLPVAALIPLLIIWAGVGDLQKILVLAIGTFFQVLVMVTDAVRRVPLMHIDTALTLGCRPGRVPFDVLLPASLPQIYDACRVGIGLTWSYLLVAEIVASENGLGYVIIRGQRFLRTDQIFFTIIVLGFLGLLYDRAFTLPRRYLFPWAQEERQV